MRGSLLLENNAQFCGFLTRKLTGIVHGEVVFTTGMCGYCESLTDPSFAGQILVFTYPIIGNYGVCDKSRWESHKAWVSGAILCQLCVDWSHRAGLMSLGRFAEEQGFPLLTGVDTRALTKMLRSEKPLKGSVIESGQNLSAERPDSSNLVSKVSVSAVSTYGKGKKRIILVDCGLKLSILRNLERWPFLIVRVPYDYDYSNEEFDGVLLSNGPGDPNDCQETIKILQKVMERGKPVGGICLGLQLMAIAVGAKVTKLPFGHRGQNQPCQELATGKCFLTSQNHGYAVEESSVPTDWQISFRNLNDGSVEGLAHLRLPFLGVQFHPEAAPGPTDTRWLFDRFLSLFVNKY